MYKLKLQDYDDGIEVVKDFINKLPNELIPEYVIQNGHIKNPGVSDIDLIFVFNDDFLQSSYFLFLFQEKIKNLKNKSIFFHHMPHIFPASSIYDLPYMTYNPTSELKFLKGSINFTSENLNEHQNILNSFEQIHNRIVMLIDLNLKQQKEKNSLLLVGHSLINSINSLKLIGANFNKEDFKNLNLIESMRQSISEGLPTKDFDFSDICNGLIREFFIILHWLNFKIERKILIHFNKNISTHHYCNNIYFTNLNKKNAAPKYSLSNGKILIEGFNWQTNCIYENYFKNISDYKSIFIDKLFLKEINKRKIFIKKLVKFNFNNFNSATGRSGLHPLIRKERYTWSAREAFI